MEFHKNLAYEASAGSGKTFALVIRYISLLYLGAKPASIVTLTFTNKAANEMKIRISQVLSELHTASRGSELKEIAKSTNLSPQEICEKREKIYLYFLQSELKISTIDKFFAQILRKFSLHLALMPDFKIEPDIDEQKFIESFLKGVKKEKRYKDLIRFATNENKKLGSIFTFLEDLYAKDGELEHIRVDTNFSNNEKEILKVAKELEELFLNCENLSPSAKKAITTNSLEDLLNKSWITKESLDYHYFKKCFTPVADELFYKLKEQLTIYYLSKDASLKQSYLELYKIYKNTKRELNITQNLLSFNDVTNSVFDLLHHNIDSDFLYFRLDAKIDHILIDEFQDTNVIQYKILEPILDEINAGLGTKDFKTLFYVGDIKQSIYRFRGGAKELFHHTKNSFDVTLLALRTNYRSTFEIVTFVNKTFKPLIDGYKEQLSLNKNGGYVKVSIEQEPLDDIVLNVFSLLEKGVKADDIAILTYTNADAYIIEESLLKREKSLKVTTQTSSKLINNWAVSAIIELLKYLYFHKAINRANFLTAIGFRWDAKLDISKFNKNQDLLTLVKNIIKHFNLYSDDGVFKFLEVIASYKDIEEFLFESEELNTQSPSKKDEGIKILTIHKSKGLEFEHVVVADRFKKKSADRSSLIFEYDDIKLKNLHVRIKNREYFDKNYANAKESLKKLSYEDELNLLYVAFTRAKESLTICQKEEKSAFSILNLDASEVGQIEPKKREKEIKEIKRLEYQESSFGAQEKKQKTEFIDNTNLEAKHFGLGLHYMLEIIEDFDLKHVESAYWAMKNRYEIFLEPDTPMEIKNRVIKLLKYKPFLELIVDGKILKEQPISYKGELKIIDLFIELEENFIIIDYKSSQKQQKEHIKQVLGYKNAMQKIVDKDVIAYLCYIRKDEIELVII